MLEKMTNTLSLQEVMDLGILQEINRRVLHPMGLALSVTVDDTTYEPIEFGPVLDCRESPTGIIFGKESDEITKKRERKANTVSSLIDSKSEAREKAFGYVIQPIETL